jgi:hypothetical protein
MTTRSGILEALWKERREYSRYEALTDLLEQGDQVITERTLGERWQWSRRRVRDFLQFLKQENAAAIDVVHGAMGAAGTRISLTLSSGERTMRATTTYAAPSPPRSDVENQVNHARRKQLRASADQASAILPLGLGFTPSLQERSSTTPTPGAHRVEGAHERQPEHERYAAELAIALNAAQGANLLIDPDLYRPVAAHHKGTLEAALAIRNARVPLEFAKRYVWQEAQRFKPTRKDPQIGSLAYLRKGMITEWIRTTARSELQERRGQRGKQVTISAVLETLDVTRRSP